MTIFRRPSHAAASGDSIPFFDGRRTHLFYLSSPPGTQDYPERVRTTWQHAVTDDFRVWEELPAALTPGEPGTFDGGGIWTGCVVETDGLFHLFYTGHHVGADNPQSICLATSTDLIHFERPDGPLILPTEGYEAVDWRDPFVFFNEEEGCWWMLIAARLAEGPVWRRGCIALATSPDLLNWTVEPEPLYAPGTTYCPECPEMWSMNGRWYMVWSRFSEEVGTIYRVADKTRGPFRVPEREDLGGRRWYAAKSAPQPDGSRVFFGWIHDRVERNGASRWLWGGDFAAPRVVTAGADGALAVALHPQAEAAFGKAGAEAIRLDAVGGEAHWIGRDALGQRVLLTAAFELGENAAEAGLALVRGTDLEGWFISIDRRRGFVRLAEEPRPLDDFWADLTQRPVAQRGVDGPVVASARIDMDGGAHGIKVLLDGELLEIYVDGAVALSHRIPRTAALYPAVYVVDGAADVRLSVSPPL